MRNLIYAVAFISGLSTLFYFSNHFGLFQIHKVQVTVSGSEAPFLIPKEKQIQTQLNQLVGQSMWKIDIDRIHQRLLTQNWIHDAQIHRIIPFYLQIEIIPRHVTLVIVGPKGKMLPVSADGTILSAISPTDVPDVPLLDGKKFIDSLDMRKKAIDLVNQLPTDGNFTAQTISEISYDDKAGFSISLRQSHSQVLLGQEQFAQKASHVSQVMSYLNAHSLEGRVIDATFSKKVLVRLRKGP